MATLADKQSGVETLVASFVAAGEVVQDAFAGESGHYRAVPTTQQLVDLGVPGLSGHLQYSESLRVDEYGDAEHNDRGWLLAVVVKNDTDSKLYERVWNFGPLSWMAHGWREIVE